MACSNSSKCTWDTATNNHILIENDRMIDYSFTKYKDKKGYDNEPQDHKVEYLVDKFISHEIPGIVANAIYEFSYDTKNKRYRFIPNKNYSHPEISKICEGNLYGVLSKTDNTIKVTYKPYDHKNEPIITEEFILTEAEKN